MTKSFDEWWSEHKKNGFVPTFSDVASNAFKAGQQSKQAEVDGLRKRIDGAIYDLQHIESAMWEEQVEHVLMILKGENHES